MDYHSSSSKLFCFLITTILLCFVTSDISPPGFLQQYCMENGNYTKNSTYQANLDNLFSTINSNLDIDYGFYNFSIGEGLERVHAIALCRGDVTLEDCKSCLNDATHKLTQVCPYNKDAIGWYGKCMLRYSNSSNIFGTHANRPSYIMSNSEKVSNPTEFSAVLGEFMNTLSSKASYGDSRHKYATDEVYLKNLEKIYGLVQCTPDLTRLDCSTCINESISQIRSCCETTRGGRFMTPSCIAQFETFRFFAPSTSPPPPPPPPPPPVETTVKTNVTNSIGKNNTSQTIIIIVVSVATPTMIIAFFCIYLRSRKSTRNNVETMGEVITMESLQYNFSTIKLATNNFSDANKLGQGGFGAVYKGRLLDGQEIAVKRLAIGGGQGHKEFKTEVMLVAKLQHRNLVKLLGFCLECDERLLIYEFVPNKSLDNFLFDRVKRSELDWKTRYKIIGGIVKGLLYIHEDSRLRVIHRDLKASNILLDAEMNPRIADFGLARLFIADQTHGDTSKIAGTYGYMAPEYVMRGQFSVKSDVYSFGVLLLEIVSGDKITRLRNGEQAEDLISYAWENWTNGTTSNFVDPTLRGGSNSEIMRCLHVGLLCVQENLSNRPVIALIAMMLNNHFITLPIPSRPSSYFTPNHTDNDSSVTTGRIINGANGGSVNDVSISEFYPR